MTLSSNNQRDNNLIEVKALLSREEDGGYGRLRTFSNHLHLNEICHWWHETVDRYGLDRELVYLSYHYFDRFLAATGRGGGITPVQGRLIKIASLLVAIKAKLSNEEVSVANEIAVETIAREHIDSQALSSTEKEMLRTLDWRLNAPTMHQFAVRYSLLHPLTAAGDDFHAEYILEMTRFQVERAVVHPEVMMNHRPSDIAFAAMMRAEEELDDSVLTLEMREEFEDMMEHELNKDSRVVQEAQFALENSIQHLPTVDEYMYMRERGDSTFVVIERGEAAAPARIPAENVGTDSPVTVAVN